MINKRNTLKAFLGIGAVATQLPSTWTKPLLSSIVLPAHAQASLIVDLQISASGPTLGGETSNDISANPASDEQVSVDLEVNTPFTLSTKRMVFEPREPGESETKEVDVLNSDRSINTTEAIKVSWLESKLMIVTSGPVINGENSNDITANSVAREAITADLEINAPFTLSEKRLSFATQEAGTSETKTVNILNPDRTVSSSESIKVSWEASKLSISTSGPVISGANSKEITADNVTREAVQASLKINAPFSLSENRLSFAFLEAGMSETKEVNILNSDGSTSSTEAIRVTWASSKLAITSSGPVLSGADTDMMTADAAAGDSVSVKLAVEAPFSLSAKGLTFKPMKVGQSESQSVDILNEDQSVNATRSISVSWVEKGKS